ncbi:MAG: diguanylate cyclase, partial [Candidatus Brocadiaceae bacterium]
WVWEQGRAVLSEDGECAALEGFITDITERRRAQEQLQESRERYRELWDDAPVAYHMLDTEGIIRRVNKTELSMLGYQAEEMVGRPIFDFIPPEQRDEARRRFRHKIRGNDVPRAHNRAYVRKDGSLIYVGIDDVLERDAEGKVTGVRTTMVDVTEQVRLREELRSMSLEDELTGLRNRRGFQHLASQQMKVAERAGNEMLLVFADVDGMKWINDTYGHREGDRALTDTADVLRRTFRDSDILARVGGDEFAVLAIEAGGDSVAEVRGRLQQGLDARNSDPERCYDLALSLGIVHYDPAHPVCLDELMSTADRLMYRDKAERNGQRPGH